MRRAVLPLVALGLVWVVAWRPAAQSAHAAETAAGWLATGQPADLMLSGHGFGRTGGALRFNHPGGVAVVGGALALADRNDNRVLLWNGIPTSGSEPPALVLGQEGFDTNHTGDGLAGLDWPTAVASDGTRLYVADTFNDRILVWRSRPTRSAQPADFALTSASGVSWPWGIWTDGTRLAVSATDQGRVLVWNHIPDGDTPPDLQLRIAEFGTPRAIESDGQRLVVSDHNARVGSGGAGNFFWNRFPSAGTEPADFFLASLADVPSGGGGLAPGEHFHDMAFLPDGRFLALGNRTLCIWSAFPRGASDTCSVRIGNGAGFDIEAGDNSGLAVAGDRLFASLDNGNRVVVWNTLPAASGQRPDDVIGSPGIDVNTLALDAIVTNPVPRSDGTRLYVSSDFDRRLHVWRRLPTASSTPPDVTTTLDFAPWASALTSTGLVLAGQNTVAIWSSPPDGQPADVVLRNQIGGVTLDDLRGVAWDGTYFALASRTGNQLSLWRGIPGASSVPLAQFQVTQPGRISSDGRYLVVTAEGPVGLLVLDLANTAAGLQPLALAGTRSNLPQDALVANGAFLLADTVNNRVLGWRDAAAAVRGDAPDVVLGASDLSPRRPGLGADRLFWPGALAVDEGGLWVGEFKFGNRLLHYTWR